MANWNLPEDWTARSAKIEDAAVVRDLFNANSQLLTGQDKYVLREMEGMLSSPRLDHAQNTRLFLNPLGQAMAWAHVMTSGHPHATIDCLVTLHPEIHQDEALWDQLYNWTLDRARSFIPSAEHGIRVSATTRATSKHTARLAAIQRAGFEQVRVQNRMRLILEELPPNPEWADGISVRCANIEQDLPAVVAAELESFRDSWGSVETSVDEEIQTWKDNIRIAGDTFKPELWYLAVEGEEIVGFAICEDRIADDTSRGYVQGLGVRPAWRRRGIAQALLLHAFRGLYDQGCKMVELDMDSENLTGALRLYERVGMRATRQSILHEKEIRAGVDVATR